MDQYVLSAMLIELKRLFNKFSDVSTLTEQLASAVDHGDEVSVQVILSMRQEPLTDLANIQESIQTQLHSLSEEDAIYMNTLLSGGAPSTPEEKKLTDQLAMNARLLERITQLDKRISLKIGGSKSYYNKYR